MTGGRRQRRKRSPSFAVGLDGQVYLSVFEMDGVETLEDATAAVAPGTPIFIGVPLTPAERRRLLGGLAPAGREAAAFIVGGRRRRSR